MCQFLFFLKAFVVDMHLIISVNEMLTRKTEPLDPGRQNQSGT